MNDWIYDPHQLQNSARFVQQEREQLQRSLTAWRLYATLMTIVCVVLALLAR